MTWTVDPGFIIINTIAKANLSTYYSVCSITTTLARSSPKPISIGKGLRCKTVVPDRLMQSLHIIMCYSTYFSWELMFTKILPSPKLPVDLYETPRAFSASRHHDFLSQSARTH